MIEYHLIIEISESCQEKILMLSYKCQNHEKNWKKM